MEDNLCNYVAIETQKKGTLKVSCTYQNKVNTYGKIRDLGFRKIKFDNKDVYIRRGVDGMRLSGINEIRNSFLEFIQKEIFFFSSMSIDYNYFINKYMLVYHIMENTSFNDIITDILTKEEMHQLRLRLDSQYLHNYKIQKIFDILKEWEFSSTVDTSGYFTYKAPLYYRTIGDKKYLIFTHYCDGNKYGSDGFDCWSAKFEDESDIGKKDPIESIDIRLSFDLDRNYCEIDEYLNTKV